MSKECCGSPNTCEQPCFHGGQKASGVDQILAERQKTHGDFSTHAGLSQNLKAVIASSSGWAYLHPAQCEALEMIAHKIARIINGDPDHIDHWADIAGYATLVQRGLEDGNE